MEQKTKQNDATKEQLLTPIMEGKFQFACHKGVPCFTDCCRDLRLVLTPFDIVRIKNRLKLSLFGEPTLEVKDEIIRTKKEKIVTM